MAKTDWTFFSQGTLPTGLEVVGTNVGFEVCPGGGTRALHGFYRGWVAPTFGLPQHMWGYRYTGPDITEFPLQNGQISLGTRSDGSAQSATRFGGFMRMQTAVSGSVPATSINCYGICTVNNTASVGQGQVGAFKLVNGVQTLIGGGPFIVNVVDAPSDFIQVEVRVINNGANVELYWRRNLGTALTLPGVGTWSAFGLLAVDATPGVLIGGGHWGFFDFTEPGNTNFSGGSKRAGFDRVRITQEIFT